MQWKRTGAESVPRWASQLRKVLAPEKCTPRHAQVQYSPTGAGGTQLTQALVKCIRRQGQANVVQYLVVHHHGGNCVDLLWRETRLTIMEAG